MADGCVIKKGERFYLGGTRQIFDCWVTVDEYLWYAANQWHLVVETPWGLCEMWAGGAGGATCANDDWSESIIFWAHDDKEGEWVEFDVERCSPPCYVRGFAYDLDENPVSGASVNIGGVAYITGDTGYTNYVECVCESGPLTAVISPPAGYTCFEGNCSVDYLCVEGYSDIKFPLVAVVPAIFQYEVIFDLTHPALVDTRALLEAEYAKYYKATAWNITPADPDCFDRLQALGGGLDQTWETGWLCQAIEYGESPCAPLPYWLCPLPTPETIYFRGECTCSNFKDNLQHLGIPCMHLIAARIYYGNNPPYCPYIPCP